MLDLDRNKIGTAAIAPLGRALKDRPRPPGGTFTLKGVALRAASAELGLPPDARDWDNDKILAHLWDAQQQGQRVRRVKLILVGHGGGGKTTLVKRLRTGAFAEQPGATDGVEVAEWREGALGPEITFSVLDCGMRARGTCTRACPRSLAGVPLPTTRPNPRAMPARRATP